MPDDATKSSKRVLEPPERISEVLFGLIMVLTFTCSFSVAEADRGEVHSMLIGALGCNVAWGIIDGLFYLMGCLSERGHSLATLRAVRKAADVKKAHRIIAGALPPLLASVLPAAEFEVMRRKLVELPDPPAYPRLTRRDWRGALGVMLLVFLSTLPPTIPFIFLGNVTLALRLSNGIAIGMLALLGYSYGRYAEHRPWGWALSMVSLGGVMVWLTIALGG
jgi:VIT1/CCC1 family predicted Fe2+/Mn2+ transporter